MMNMGRAIGVVVWCYGTGANWYYDPTLAL
jgi:hypothetical protein